MLTIKQWKFHRDWRNPRILDQIEPSQHEIEVARAALNGSRTQYDWRDPQSTDQIPPLSYAVENAPPAFCNVRPLDYQAASGLPTIKIEDDIEELDMARRRQRRKGSRNDGLWATPSNAEARPLTRMDGHPYVVAENAGEGTLVQPPGDSVTPLQTPAASALQSPSVFQMHPISEASSNKPSAMNGLTAPSRLTPAFGVSGFGASQSLSKTPFPSTSDGSQGSIFGASKTSIFGTSKTPVFGTSVKSPFATWSKDVSGTLNKSIFGRPHPSALGAANTALQRFRESSFGIPNVLQPVAGNNPDFGSTTMMSTVATSSANSVAAKARKTAEGAFATTMVLPDTQMTSVIDLTSPVSDTTSLFDSNTMSRKRKASVATTILPPKALVEISTAVTSSLASSARSPRALIIRLRALLRGVLSSFTHESVTVSSILFSGVFTELNKLNQAVPELPTVQLRSILDAAGDAWTNREDIVAETLLIAAVKETEVLERALIELQEGMESG